MPRIAPSVPTPMKRISVPSAISVVQASTCLMSV